MTNEQRPLGVPRRAARRLPALPPRVWTCLGVLLLAALAGALGPYLLADVARQDVLNSLTPPLGFEGGSGEHLLGTDALGRDQLARVVVGTRTSLLVAFLGTAVASVAGVLIGVLAGYLGGWPAAALMRLADIQLAVPAIVLVMFGVAVLGRDLPTIIVVLGLATWVPFARVAQAQVASLREQDLVTAARSMGISGWHIILRHVLPNISGPLFVLASVEVGALVIAEAALGYLGLGLPPPAPTLGGMISEGQEALTAGIWWPVAVPGAVIALVVLSANVLGDWLRDVSDPRTKGRTA